jgi:iron complex outermembrane receptor protein
MKSRLLKSLLLTCLMGTIAGGVSHANAADQTADSNPSAKPVLEEIVVTARKRDESLQSTPVAISAITEEQLAEQHADTLVDIAQQLPNIQIFRQAAVGGVATTYLRGFGAATNDPSVDPPVAMYVDGIYIPQVNGSLVDTFDVAQVEVDRGPQDTLLGKNSPVGAVVITTKKPTGDLDADVQADYGSYGYWGIRGRADVPIVDGVLAGNISVLDESGGNYTYNYFTHSHDMGGVDKQVVRLGLNYTPNDRFSWWVTGSVAFNHDPQTADRDGSTAIAYPPFAAYVPDSCLYYGHCKPLPWGTTDSEHTNHNSDTQGFVSSQMSYRFDPVTINFDSGVIGYTAKGNNDIDGEPELILEVKNGKTGWNAESGELRISSNKGGGWDLGGKLDWLVGAYGFDEIFHQDASLYALDIFCPGGCPVVNGQKGQDKSQAVFGHFQYNITDALNITFGVRQTWDQKEHSYYEAPGSPFIKDQPDSWQNVSYEAGVQYQITDDKMVYFRFAQGYRGGGFVGVPATAGAPDTFNPETNNTYEVGAKTQWFDDRLRVNLDVFHGDFANLQKDIYLPNPLSPANLISVTQNVASATVQGVEIEAETHPIDPLTIGVNLGWLETSYNSYFADIIGNGIPMQLAHLQDFGFSPQFTGSVNAAYTFDLNDMGDLSLRGNFNVRTHQYLDDLTSPAARQSGYGLVNASLEWNDPTDRYSVSIFGKNIFSQHYESDAAPIALVSVLVDGQPATWGITLKAHF